MNDKFESCTNCIHAHDAEPLCILRLCKHAIAETKECYESKAQTTIEPKKGKWIDKSNGIEGAWNYCSVCGEQAIDLYDFCPNCGARMTGNKE